MKMLIGLTGKTGSGKSSAAKMFEALGCFVADCDIIAHEVLKSPDVKARLVSLFSDEILNKSNEIDRKALGRIVFADNDKLNSLNSVMHEEIVKKAVGLCTLSEKDICIIDGSELEASGADNLCRHIIVVRADDDTRLQRILKRDNIDKESASLRMSSQKDYSKEAIIIENNGDEEALAQKVNALYNKFLGEVND